MFDFSDTLLYRFRPEKLAEIYLPYFAVVTFDDEQNGTYNQLLQLILSKNNANAPKYINFEA